jgi:molecular chaperone DnaK
MVDVIVGIDLGTTNSEVAALVDGNVQVLAVEGEQIMPSFVGVSPDGTPLVGTPARNQYVVYPERTVKSIKRLMGSNERVALGEQTYSPPEISAMILRALRTRAEAALGGPVRRAVVTVPAYFSDAQRQATRDAGEIAGLEVVRILNEPTAAALAYGADRQGDRTVLVYDLGGGTFDVSLVQVSGDVTEVLASHGNNHLGGDDFDQLLLDLVLTRFIATGTPDVRGDRRAMNRLLRAAEEAKKRLSFEPYTRLREEHLSARDGVPVHLDLEISREEYERLISHLIDGTLDSVHRALADAGKQPGEVDEILLVGGVTRTPLVSQRLRDTTGLAPRQDVHPDLCVALGAGVLAARLAGHDVDRVLVDISPYSFGPSYFGFVNGRPSEHCYHPVIARNTPLPASRTDCYVTMVDNQEAWQVSVYQGDDPNALNDILVGRFLIEGLSPVPAGNEVLCRMDLDLDGILRVTATEKRTGLAKHITIEGATTAMSDAQMAEARRRMRDLFGDPEDLAQADLDEDALADDEADPDDDIDLEEAEPERSGLEEAGLDESRASDSAPATGGGRERRVAISEARALLERGQRLLARMSAEDREEAVRLQQAIEKAIGGGDWDRLRAATGDLADLLFYVEEG